MNVLALYGLLVLTTLPPLVPNSALLVAAGVLASHGDLCLPLVLLIVAGSAALGDVLMYLIARRFGGPARAWMRRRARRRALMEWTSRRIERYGIPFVIAVRFLPSGRIIGAVASGVLHYPLRKYALGTGIAEAVWATYSVGLGYLGSAVADNRLHSAGIGIGVSCAVAALATAVQWTARRRAARLPDDGPSGGRRTDGPTKGAPGNRRGSGRRTGGATGDDGTGGGSGPEGHGRAAAPATTAPATPAAPNPTSAPAATMAPDITPAPAVTGPARRPWPDCQCPPLPCRYDL
ncbi:DedA family protein [Streptomyces pinistramenti]|uniref:DedA family protein n=1 Tax=Streptomyces pinistramenti TaxID=2884812 RepID=UPI001D080396|nr:DedA family protein [Streptomyces pinistramenti]MCB5908010.1 DedA family protein [Streptomyces pinistramenti]